MAGKMFRGERNGEKKFFDKDQKIFFSFRGEKTEHIDCDFFVF